MSAPTSALTKPPTWSSHWASRGASELKEMLAGGTVRGWIHPPPGKYSAEEFAAWLRAMQMAYPSFEIAAYENNEYGDSQEFSVQRPLTKGEVEEIEQLINKYEHRLEDSDKGTYDDLRKRHPDWFSGARS